MNVIKYSLFCLASIAILDSCNSGGISKQSIQLASSDSSSSVIDTNAIQLHALNKLFVTGDFDGDGKTDTLFQHNFSLANQTEIYNAPDPFKNEWDTVVNWFYRQDPQIYICVHKTGQDTIKLGEGQGLYCLLNIGDNNKDGKDEIAFVVDYLDYSRVNSCKIYSLCDNKWIQLKQIGIHEDAFNFNSELNPHPVFPEINEYLEKHNGKWMYKDYTEEVTEPDTYTGEMKELVIDLCNSVRSKDN